MLLIHNRKSTRPLQLLDVTSILHFRTVRQLLDLASLGSVELDVVLHLQISLGLH